MGKFSKFSIAAVLLAITSLPTSAKEFSYKENFDDDASFTVSQDMPDGWLSKGTFPFKRYNAATEMYISAYSGDYVFGTLTSYSYGRDEVFSTKALALKGGVEYTFSFYVQAPGGAPSSVRNNSFVIKAGTGDDEATFTQIGELSKKVYADWTKESFKFTPEADGEYRFSISLTTSMASSGYVVLDDVEVTGTEPDAPVAAEPPYAENFDDDATFTASQDVPDGWLSNGTFPFKRYKASDMGISAYSGDYLFGTTDSYNYGRDEVVMTKPLLLKAGTEYTFSFYVYAPGGSPSSVRNNPLTIKVGTGDDAAAFEQIGETTENVWTEWTKESFKFTPQTDGEYRFAIALGTKLSSAGLVALDDVEVTGAETEEPEEKVVVELPYSQSFDNENGDYPGDTFLPNGWLATGTMPFVTANSNDMPAVTGTYYMVADESPAARDEYAYTPYFDLKKGTEYTVKFYLYMPGHDDRTSSISFSVGKEQKPEGLTSLLALQNVQNTEWEKQTVKFTPEEDGLYCFAFALSGDAPYAGIVAVEDFTVESPTTVWKPRAAFSYNGLFNIMDSKLAVFPGSKVKMYSTSEYADTYEWKAEGAIPETSTEKDPEFEFTDSGEYEVSLTVKNSAGESTATRKLDVSVVEDVDGLGFSSVNPSGDKILERGSIPTFDTDKDFDFVSGLNHYYYNFAEEYKIPEGQKLALSSISVYLTNYNVSVLRYRDFLDSKFSVVAYGAKDGRPDLDKVYGRFDSTMEGVFGSMGISKAEMRNVVIDKPINVDGPFFLAFEFDDDIVIDETDKNITRSAFAIGAVKHLSRQSTLFVQPTSTPEGVDYKIDGGYCMIDSISKENAGLGLSFTLWVKDPEIGTDIALVNNGSTMFAARLVGDELTISGTNEGEAVAVCNVSGAVVATAKAVGASTTLHVGDLAKGVYIVSCNGKSVKFVKK